MWSNTYPTNISGIFLLQKKTVIHIMNGAKHLDSLFLIKIIFTFTNSLFQQLHVLKFLNYTTENVVIYVQSLLPLLFMYKASPLLFMYKACYRCYLFTKLATAVIYVQSLLPLFAIKHSALIC